MYNDILVAVDLNDETSAKKTVDVAVACCRTFGARLHLLAVVPDFGMSIVSQYFPDDYAQKAVDGAVATLAAFKDANVPDDIEARDIITNGTVYDEILATAKKNRCRSHRARREPARSQGLSVGPERLARRASLGALGPRGTRLIRRPSGRPADARVGMDRFSAGAAQ